MSPATIECRGPFLIAHFAEPQTCVGWAVVNGGRVRASRVAWYYVNDSETGMLHDPAAFLRHKLGHADLADAVGLVTARQRYGHVETFACFDNQKAWCLATVGLRNSLRIGDLPYTEPSAATINLLCWASEALSTEAGLEAIAIAAEARTTAMLGASIPSVVSGLPATGTGTDCIVIAHPTHGLPCDYAGKHTVIGHLIGKCVHEAVSQGIREWVTEFGLP